MASNLPKPGNLIRAVVEFVDRHNAAFGVYPTIDELRHQGFGDLIKRKQDEGEPLVTTTGPLHTTASIAHAVAGQFKKTRRTTDNETSMEALRKLGSNALTIQFRRELGMTLDASEHTLSKQAPREPRQLSPTPDHNEYEVARQISRADASNDEDSRNASRIEDSSISVTNKTQTHEDITSGDVVERGESEDELSAPRNVSLSQERNVHDCNGHAIKYWESKDMNRGRCR